MKCSTQIENEELKKTLKDRDDEIVNLQNKIEEIMGNFKESKKDE